MGEPKSPLLQDSLAYEGSRPGRTYQTYVRDTVAMIIPIEVPKVCGVANLVAHDICKLRIDYRKSNISRGRQAQQDRLTPEQKPYAKAQTTTPPVLVAAVQVNATTDDVMAAIEHMLKWPYLSASQPAEILPKSDAALRIDTR